ncbi:hypothetical protein MRX96_003474 [Rhipicephalus microplus]
MPWETTLTQVFVAPPGSTWTSSIKSATPPDISASGQPCHFSGHGSNATMWLTNIFRLCLLQGTRPGSQRGEPTASPHGRNHRDVATWTSQDGGDPPVSYVSSRPWRRQERARVGVAPAHLYRPFQGRTVEDADRRANGACLPVPAGTRFCECGAVVIHNSHELGKLHRHRTQATQPSSRESSQERSGAAVRAMLARAAQEADFAQWLLRVASGHASSESPPAPLSITATVERGAAGPGETLVAAALTPEVASMTLEAGLSLTRTHQCIWFPMARGESRSRVL